MLKKKIFLFFLIFFPVFAFAQPTIHTLPSVSIDVLLRRLGDLLFYALVSLAFIFVLWGGITIVTAGGDPNKIETAKRMIVFALVGIAIGVMAFGIVNLVYSYLARR